MYYNEKIIQNTTNFVYLSMYLSSHSFLFIHDLFQYQNYSKNVTLKEQQIHTWIHDEE